jgi:hypothetical protein
MSTGCSILSKKLDSFETCNCDYFLFPFFFERSMNEQQLDNLWDHQALGKLKPGHIKAPPELYSESSLLPAMQAALKGFILPIRDIFIAWVLIMIPLCLIVFLALKLLKLDLFQQLGRSASLSTCFDQL